MFPIRLLFVSTIAVSSAFCASQAIGIAVANGAFQIDRSSVYGNTTLFDGSVIETNVVSSDLVLHDGARLRLGAQSEARVHSDRLVLEKGQTEISGSSGYAIEALGLRVAPDSPQGRLAVIRGPSRIQVAALMGGARVSSLNGILIANVAAGTALDLQPQASGATTPSKIVGILESKDGAVYLTDEVTLVTYTLSGSDLDQYLGKRVEVTGAIKTGTETSAGSSPPSMRVLKVRELDKAARRGGMSTRSRAIIAGVAVAASGGAVAAIAVTRGSSKSTISTQ